MLMCKSQDGRVGQMVDPPCPWFPEQWNIVKCNQCNLCVASCLVFLSNVPQYVPLVGIIRHLVTVGICNQYCQHFCTGRTGTTGKIRSMPSTQTGYFCGTIFVRLAQVRRPAIRHDGCQGTSDYTVQIFYRSQFFRRKTRRRVISVFLSQSICFGI